MVVNPGDNDPDNDFVDILYSVVVEDDTANVIDGDTLTNTVTVTASTGAQTPRPPM